MWPTSERTRPGGSLPATPCRVRVVDSDANADDSGDAQKALMDAMIGSRGVPGGLQAVAADVAVGEGATSDDAKEISADTAQLLGISDETLEGVRPNQGESVLPATEESSDAGSALAQPASDIAPEIEAAAVAVSETVGDTEVAEDTEVVEEGAASAIAVEPATNSMSEAERDAAVEVDSELAADEPQGPPDNIDEANPDGVGRIVLEWAAVLVGAVVMALVLRQFIFQAFWIPSESMETTLEISDRVLVNRLSYQWGDVSRGDVIVFARKPEEIGEIRDLIKRVIGLPGDTVEARGNQIFINGTRLDEPYVAEENRIFADFGPVTVPDHELFVMGDNRDQSFDSRLFGTVDLDRVAGRAFVLFWPLDRIGAL